MKMATGEGFSVKKTHIKQNLIFGGFFKKKVAIFCLSFEREKTFFNKT
jgi:hypothetical protein